MKTGRQSDIAGLFLTDCLNFVILLKVLAYNVRQEHTDAAAQ